MGVTACLLARASRAGVALVALVLSSTGAWAAPGAPRLELRVDGQCPAADEVRAALREALPDILFAEDDAVGRPQGADDAAAAAADDGIPVLVADRGASLRVLVGATIRELVRPGRDCAARAREAALVIALTLEPPRLLDPAPPPVTAVTVAAAVAPRPSATAPPWHVDLSVVALGAAASHDGFPASLGGGARVEVARGILGGALGAGAFAPVTLVYGAARVEVLRVPLDVSATVALRRPRYEFGIQAGLALVPFMATGEAEAVPMARTSTGLDVGARVAAVAGWRFTDRLGLLLGVEALFVPVPSHLVIDRGPTLGPTPWLFAGASLGLWWRIR